uniref:Uncharacterized protein n=1 Tax=Setaria digitata TaxID=48799 RepID=A0A915PI60_9BILA
MDSESCYGITVYSSKENSPLPEPIHLDSIDGVVMKALLCMQKTTQILHRQQSRAEIWKGQKAKSNNTVAEVNFPVWKLVVHRSGLSEALVDEFCWVSVSSLIHDDTVSRNGWDEITEMYMSSNMYIHVCCHVMLGVRLCCS